MNRPMPVLSMRLTPVMSKTMRFSPWASAPFNTASIRSPSGLFHRPAKLEDGIQARDPETLAHLSLRPRHPQLAAALLHLIEAVDEPADARAVDALDPGHAHRQHRSEEHTSELQSPCNLVCR